MKKIEKAKGTIEKYTVRRFWACCPYCGEILKIGPNTLRYKCPECDKIFDIEWK